MSTPSFYDIGKKIKDLLDKNFPAGFIKLAARIPQTESVEASMNTDHNIDSGKLQSAVEWKLASNALNHDFLLTEKWTLNNEVQSSVEITPRKNLKSSLDFYYEPNTGRKSLKLRNNYKVDLMNINADLEFRQIQPNLSVTSIFKPVADVPFFVGGQLAFDSYKLNLEKYNAAIQYDNGKTSFSAITQNTQSVLVQLYQKLPFIELAAETHLPFDTKQPFVTICANKQITTKNTIKFKVDCELNSSIAYSFLINEGIRMTLGTRFDLKNLNGGGHKIGLQIDVNN